MAGERRRLGRDTQPDVWAQQTGGAQVQASVEGHGSPLLGCWQYGWGEYSVRGWAMSGGGRLLVSRQRIVQGRRRHRQHFPKHVLHPLHRIRARSDSCAGRDGGGSRHARRVGQGSGSVGCRAVCSPGLARSFQTAGRGAGVRVVVVGRPAGCAAAAGRTGSGSSRRWIRHPQRCGSPT